MVKQKLAQKLAQKILARKKTASSGRATSSGRASRGRASRGRASRGRAGALVLAISITISITISLAISLAVSLAYSSINSAKAELNLEQKNQLAHQFILKNGSAMANVMGDKKISQKKKRHLLKNILEKNIDTNIMTRVIIGKYRRQMDEQQQQRYTLAASQWILLYSASLLSTLNSVSFEVIAAKTIGKDVLVKTNIKEQKNTPPIPINWRVRINKNDEPTLIDVHIEGLSVISAQHGEAKDIIAEFGINGFLDKLDQRFDEMKKQF